MKTMHRFGKTKTKKIKTRTSESKECNGMESSDRERGVTVASERARKREIILWILKAFERLHIILKQYRLFRLRLELCVCSFEHIHSTLQHAYIITKACWLSAAISARKMMD